MRRLAALGIRARVMRGGEAAIATMPLSTRPFPGLERSVRLPGVVFASVGPHHIKCLKPLDLFCLPPIEVRGCESASELEERIRATWRERLERLEAPWAALAASGTRAHARGPESVLRIPIEGEARGVEAVLLEPGELVLPGRGPLSGLPLRSCAERVLRLPRGKRAGVELQLALSRRLDELRGRSARRLGGAGDDAHGSSQPEIATVGVRSHRILLVGPRLSVDSAVVAALRLRGHAVETARSATEAVRLYHRCSPELVITDADLGRSEGCELVPMLAASAGVEHIPVIVVDTRHHAARREAARRMGAHGYLSGPLRVERIAGPLARVLERPARRRFTRYARPVPVRLAATGTLATATRLSRGGLYVAAPYGLCERSLQRCELVLPGAEQRIEVEAEVRYSTGGGVGLRFDRFGTGAEVAYLEFLRGLDRRASAAALGR